MTELEFYKNLVQLNLNVVFRGISNMKFRYLGADGKPIRGVDAIKTGDSVFDCVYIDDHDIVKKWKDIPSGRPLYTQYRACLEGSIYKVHSIICRVDDCITIRGAFR